ncbi:hypothetical protein [Brucella tritici]|uniref:hypothetical protein n=1 Tax=Brucella tritici TaxID=94626 RepID=UPI00158FB287|nr:hypothetical protein [Brucella tritici]
MLPWFVLFAFINVDFVGLFGMLSERYGRFASFDLSVLKGKRKKSPLSGLWVVLSADAYYDWIMAV